MRSSHVASFARADAIGERAGYDSISIERTYVMASKDGKHDPLGQRRYRRRDVSLRARFSVDGDTYHSGVATSLSADGAFVQTEMLFQMNTRLVIEIPLGAEQGELRAVARIVYLNKRMGAHVLSGFGLQLVEPPEELRQRLETFVEKYSAPVAIERDGRIGWPFGHEPGSARQSERGLELIEADATGDAWSRST
jgi:hypothetical protein